MYSLEARFARWLLTTHDRVQGRDFVLTQEFLVNMLSVHRPSVSMVAAVFQKDGIIQYMRGQMKILDRAKLEAISCECSTFPMANAASYHFLTGQQRI